MNYECTSETNDPDNVIKRRAIKKWVYVYKKGNSETIRLHCALYYNIMGERRASGRIMESSIGGGRPRGAGSYLHHQGVLTTCKYPRATRPLWVD